MTDPQLCELASRASYAIVMALDTGSSVENWTQSCTWVMSPLKLRLIEGESIPGRLGYSITDALRAGIPC